MKKIFLPLWSFVLLSVFATAQPSFQITNVAVHPPDITAHVRVHCLTKPTANNYVILDNGVRITNVTTSCDTGNTTCCVSTALVIDRSGSMSWGTPPTLDGAKEGAKAYINAMNTTNCDEATLISFNSSVTVDVFMTSDTGALKQGVNALTAVGGTAVWDAGITGITEVINNGTQQCKAVILLTDGEDNASTNTSADVWALALANQIRVFTIGIGTSINEEDLRKIADLTGGTFYLAANPNQLTGIFSDIYARARTLPHECDITYKNIAPCLNGAERTIAITLSGLAACSGSTTKSSTYTLPIDSTTLIPLSIRIDSVVAEPGDAVDLSLLLDTPMSGKLAPSTFDVLFDQYLLGFSGYQSAGFYFAGIPFDISPLVNGIRHRSGKETGMINGSGVLLKFRFQVNPLITDDIDIPVLLQNWIFTGGCYRPIAINGVISIRKRIFTLTAPSAGTVLCTGAMHRFEWTSKNITNIRIELTRGGQPTAYLITDTTNAASSLWIGSIPQGLPPDSTYRIVVRDINKGGAVVFTSDKFTIRQSPQIVAHPSDQTICTGSSATFSANVTGFPSPAFQWQKKSPNDPDFSNVVGETNSTLVLANVQQSMSGTFYRLRCKNSCDTNVFTQAALLSVDAPPQITSQPASVTACTGSTVRLKIGLSGVPLSFQWRKNGSPVSGATSDSLILANVVAADTGDYDLVIVGACSPSQITSSLAKVRLYPTISVITLPKKDTLCEGTSLNLSVNASGLNLSYQWMKDGVEIPAAVSPTYSLPGAAQTSAGDYRVKISDSCKTTTVQISEVSVKLKPVITAQPQGSTICPGMSLSLTVIATGANSIQWKKDGVTIPGATTATLTITNAQTPDGGRYTVEVLNSCGVTTSNDALVKISKRTAITLHPQSKVEKEGNSVTFTVTAEGDNLTYQWMKNGVNIPGGTGPSLTISSIRKSDEGNYTVVINSLCGPMVTSNIASLSVTLVKVTDVRAVSTMPMLFQNYPNPFGGASQTRSDWTDIRFLVGQKENVRIAVLDLLGREVTVLTNREYEAGEYRIRFHASELQSGMYLYQLRTQKHSIVKRMTMLK